MKPEVLEQIQELLNELEEYAVRDVPILVEGPRDEKALRELGISGRILCVSGTRKTILNFLEGLVAHEQVVILTDFDQAGNELAKFCATHLKRLGSEPIVEVREKLKALLHKDVKDIQGLAKFLRGKCPR